MPEGDTVYRAARRLDDVLAGMTVTEFDLRVPRLATIDLVGLTVEHVVPRGKHLLHRIGPWTLHSHLKMEGEWHVYRRGERWRKPAFTARAVIGTTDWQTRGCDLAELALVPRTDEDDLVSSLGPDPLRDDWDPAEAAKRIRADTRPIHVAILDQRNVAGWGNVYANEILFVRGVDPRTPATDTDARAIVELGARMIRANRDRGTRTFTGENTPGRRVWVYRRDGAPCRRCGTTIRATTLGADVTRERNVFWCPRCQPRLEARPGEAPGSGAVWRGST